MQARSPNPSRVRSPRPRRQSKTPGSAPTTGSSPSRARPAAAAAPAAPPAPPERDREWKLRPRTTATDDEVRRSTGKDAGCPQCSALWTPEDTARRRPGPSSLPLDRRWRLRGDVEGYAVYVSDLV